MRVRGYAPGTPCWAEVASPDPVAARAFYGGLFGWQFNDDGQFTLNGRAAAGLRTAARGGPAAWLISVATDDPAGNAEAVVRAGGTVKVPPTSVRDLGTMAVLADAGGAVFGTWLRSRFGGAQVSFEPGAICWYELASHDLDRTGAFYGEVFGWHPVETENIEPYFEFHHHNDAVGGLLPIDGRFPTGRVPEHWTACFMVEDAVTACERAAELGGMVARKPMPSSAGWYARVADPAGAHFALIEISDEYGF